jgi:hypothetical protein
MQSTDNTPEKWETIIATLTNKDQISKAEITALTQQRDALALDSEMGINGAAAQLQKLTAAISSRQNLASTIATAIGQARLKLREARQRESEEAERERTQQISEALTVYFEQVKLIDDAMRLLSSRFDTAKAALDRGEALMNSQERTPVQQLRSQFGATLAACVHGLGSYIQLGPLAMHAVSMGKPLAQFTIGFIDRWVVPAKLEEKPQEVVTK